VFFLLVFLIPGARADMRAKARPEHNCPEIRKEFFKGFVYKVENEGREVYVTSVWDAMMIDQKRQATFLIAACYSPTGTVKILDGRTGKQLSQWGITGYVNE